MTTEKKSEFENRSGFQIGVIQYTEEGKQHAVTVPPGETVWLSEREQVATANAPRRAEDNPLANGQLVEITTAREVRQRRPLRPPAAGSRAATEEVGTPAAEPVAPPKQQEPKKQQPAKTDAEIAAQAAVQPPVPADRTTKAPAVPKAPAEEVGTPKAKPQKG